jgi:hypothetical protein
MAVKGTAGSYVSDNYVLVKRDCVELYEKQRAKEFVSNKLLSTLYFWACEFSNNVFLFK